MPAARAVESADDDGRLPGLLVDRGQPRRERDPFGGAGREAGARLPGPLEKLQGHKKRVGRSFDWGSAVGSEFNRELGFLHIEEELKPFLEDELPPAVEQNADARGVDVATYVSEGPGLSANTLSGRHRLPDLTTARGLAPAMGCYGW
jgi:hypothetical protein